METRSRPSLAYSVFGFIALSTLLIWDRYQRVNERLTDGLSVSLGFEIPMTDDRRFVVNVTDAHQEDGLSRAGEIPLTEYAENMENDTTVTENDGTSRNTTTIQVPTDENSTATATTLIPTENNTATTTTLIPNSALLDVEVFREFDPYGLPKEELVKLRAHASIDYFSCCGLGHRLSKLSDAYYVAQMKNLSIRMLWGLCDDTDVAHFLFKPQPPWDMPNITMVNTSIRLTNEVWGFKKMIRWGPNSTCVAKEYKFWSDVRMYRSLRERYRFRQKVYNFRKRMFSNHTVIGVHIRAGNNETGDFLKKRRTLDDIDSWVSNMVVHIKEVGSAAPPEYPPLLYIATDTPFLISAFRRSLEGTMPVMDLPQRRAREGAGVLFGERGSVTNEGRICLEGWISAMTDMILLSYADVVIAGRPSSFVQTMPMTMAFAQPKETRVYAEPFCEIIANATERRCYRDFMQWACEGTWDFFFPPMNQKYEYLRVPYDPEETDYLRRANPRNVGPVACTPSRTRQKPWCLSYDNPVQALSDEMRLWVEQESQ